MGHDLLEPLLAGQNGGEHDAVVGAAGLGIEEGDVIGLRGLRHEPLDKPPRAHAGPDDDKPFSGHRGHSAATAAAAGAFGLGLAPCSYSSRKSSTCCR